ncbi:MAG: alpha/beta-type small acid-soluble spore protein [Defluviitaleaceae bacterium]|nr:alpha/beta-type small acid-soluble spore protein [Defluviitaleaceae bacterium]
MEKKPKKLTANDVLKYEIAAELGLAEKVADTGWRSLTARESGRIGGILAKRRKNMRLDGNDVDEMAVEEFWLE